MSSYTKILTLPLTNLNNAEYLTYMNSVLSLLPPSSGGGEEDRPGELSLDDEVQANGSPDLGLTKEFVATFERDLMALADVVDESRAAQETEQAQVHEANRDSLSIYVTTRISRAASLPLEAERDAGKALYKVVKPYIGIARLPVAQETAKIQGLLLDLRKPENAEHVTTLGLDAYLAELEKENNAYIAVTSQRTQSRAASKKESGIVLRKRIGAQYDDLVMSAQSYNVVHPNENTQSFVKNLNQLIAETVAAFNSRSKRKKSGGGGSTDDDRPGEL